MRFLVLSLLMVTAACGRSDPASDVAASNATSPASARVQWGSGRDKLCLDNEIAGLIVYAEAGEANCTVRGTASRSDGQIRIQPVGDDRCTIMARTDGKSVILGDVSPACAYYCGPKSSYAGKRLDPIDVGDMVVDNAGDPLC